MTKVYLGGTCNESTWRYELIEMLEIEYFNPIVDDWTPEFQAEEIRQRVNCDYCLYVITPKMTGVYSIAEVVDDSNKRPGKTMLCILMQDDGKTFSHSQIRSLRNVGKLVSANGCYLFYELKQCAVWLNEERKTP